MRITYRIGDAYGWLEADELLTTSPGRLIFFYRGPLWFWEI